MFLNPMKFATLTLCLLMFSVAACAERNNETQTPLNLPDKIIPRPSVIHDFTPTPLGQFLLQNTATKLTKMNKSEYLVLQKKWVGDDYPACNYFVITALCESGYCEKGIPMYRAAEFDQYFKQTGWEETDLSTLKNLFVQKQKFDAVFQIKGYPAGHPGHISIPVAYNTSANTFTIAQGDLGTATNEIVTRDENFLMTWHGGFHVFIKKSP